ncbi:MAG TPA: hypothetical protein VF553_12365 [Pyrinomonadaceae bacterium]
MRLLSVAPAVSGGSYAAQYPPESFGATDLHAALSGRPQSL